MRIGRLSIFLTILMLGACASCGKKVNSRTYNPDELKNIIDVTVTLPVEEYDVDERDEEARLKPHWEQESNLVVA